MDQARIEALLKDVHELRSILIRVGTGALTIQQAEPGYIPIRARVSQNLQSLKIVDPNRFQSLWDWYGYWRANGLRSYQSRREYINALYQPVVDALEQTVPGSDKPTGDAASFSARHGYAPDQSEPEIKVREDAPQELRKTIVEIAVRAGLDYDDLHNIAGRIGKFSWEHSEPEQAGTSSRVQLASIVSKWAWYLVYDF